MTNRFQLRRTPTSGNTPTSLLAGELALNLADRNAWIGDASGATQTLLGVRVFAATASYAIGDIVSYGGALFKALVAVTPAAFNGAQWAQISTSSAFPGNAAGALTNDGSGVLSWGSYASVPSVTAAQNTANAAMPKAGGAFTGPVTSNSTLQADVGASTVKPSGATVSRTLAARFKDEVNVLDFGADPTGAADSGPAINAAIASSASPAIYIPPGIYKISTTIQVNKTYCAIRGAGAGVTVLANSTANLPTLVASGLLADINMLQGWFSDFTLDRGTISNGVLTANITAVSGGDGFRSDLSNTFTSGEIQLFNILSTHNYNGFYLGNSTNSYVDRCTAQNNQGAGFYMSNGVWSPSLQWSTLNCLSQFNNYGWVVQSTVPTTNAPVGGYSSTNPAYITVGFFWNCTTFANLYQGFWFQGSAAAQVCDIVLDHCWIGSDGGDGLYADTYGFNNRIDNTSFELSSTYGTTTYPNGIGPTQAVAAPMAGNGINLTANNQDWRITGGFISQCAYNGITTTCSVSTVIVGLRVYNIGQKTYNIYHGIVAQQGHGPLIVTGCSSTGPVGGGNQHTGISVYDATIATISDCDLRFNTIGYQAVTNGVAAMVRGCIGYNTRNGGQVTVAANATSVVVTHGLTGTPVIVNITPAGAGIAAGWYIGALNATSFTIYFPTPSAYTEYLSWQACLTSMS